ncbi:MAG TPA: DNA-processing protein DprA [Methylomirabilota bacterium]|nr:DNA-processing protein DprA [Methylomirabilota bacterium]
MRRLARQDPEYPAQLRDVPDAPEYLHVRGVLVREDALAVAVVGARRATPYGTAFAEDLGGELASRGVTVVSGLARGIDSAAHRGALRAGGRTIAVLGSGVDVIYPPENRRLAAEIEGHGALVSQFAPGTPPLAHHFPARNRVIAGLSLGVVVVEAAEKSGALITARLAAELGREVMAVPGRVTAAQSRGAHALIRDGAALVRDGQDVIDELPARWRQCVRPPAAHAAEEPRRGADTAEGVGDAGEERALLEAVGEEPVTMDDVIERSGLASGRVAALLVGLELQGRVRQVEGQRFVQVGRG